MQQLVQDIANLPQRSHTCAFYETPEERLQLLAAYYRAGLKRKELCVFVTNQAPTELIADLKRHNLDIQDAVDHDNFQIHATQPTYWPSGRFEGAAMLSNLRLFVKQAKDYHSGVRGGGDMEWLAEPVPNKETVTDYEAKINRFIRTSSFTGMCFFPKKLLDHKLTAGIIQTHQTMIRNGGLLANPHYVPPEQSFKFDLITVAKIEGWLDRLDEQEASLAPT